MIRGIGSLFSGIGGLELGLERAGLGPVVWQCEIDPFCRTVLAKHWPSAKRYEDVRAIDEHVPRVDLICGGFPCQDISIAGKRGGIDGERSGLWSEFARIVGVLRPRFVVVENVAALLGFGMGRVLGDLSHLGYDAQWSALSAADVGACHERARVFIIAHDRSERIPWVRPQAVRRFPALQRREDGGGASTFGGRSDLRTSELCRTSDGVPARMDRLHALGNAVVPQCAELVGNVIVQMLGDRAA